MSDARHEERHRLVSMAAAVPLWMLCAPLVLPFGGDESLIEMTDGEPALLSILAGLAFSPLFVGALGLVEGVRRASPGKWLFRIPAVWCFLVALAMAIVLLLFLATERTGRREPFVWAGLVLILAALIRVFRSFSRAGWERFTHLLGGIWLVGLVVAVALGFSPKPYFMSPAWGEWTFLFALAALAPLVAFARLSGGR